MISTAVGLLEASLATIHAPESMLMAKALVQFRNDMDEDTFIKALYSYSSHLVAKCSSEIIDVLLTDEQMSDLNATIQELDEMETIFNGK
jgi:hypothetical protein